MDKEKCCQLNTSGLLENEVFSCDLSIFLRTLAKLSALEHQGMGNMGKANVKHAASVPFHNIIKFSKHLCLHGNDLLMYLCF